MSMCFSFLFFFFEIQFALSPDPLFAYPVVVNGSLWLSDRELVLSFPVVISFTNLSLSV